LICSIALLEGELERSLNISASLTKTPQGGKDSKKNSIVSKLINAAGNHSLRRFAFQNTVFVTLAVLLFYNPCGLRNREYTYRVLNLLFNYIFFYGKKFLAEE
jgi:hypothetical protein